MNCGYYIIGFNQLLIQRSDFFFLYKSEGGTAVDAVEQAIRVFEGDDHFNAGRGSCLNIAGNVECDAMIMNGHEMKTGPLKILIFMYSQ